MSTKIKLKPKKIESPLAKYNSTGQLFCVLCNAQVKNEIYWTGHINGKQHRDNVLALKQKPPAAGFKRPADPPARSGDKPPPEKIQKQEPKPTPVVIAEQDLAALRNEEEKKKLLNTQVPQVQNVQEDDDADDTPPQAPVPESKSLPAGFFDDPKEDAKARGVKFKNPQDEEWDKFVKEIATEDIKSNEIVGIEQEASAVDRELEQIEEQMVHWQRVIDLEKRAKNRIKQTTSKPMDVDQNEASDDDGDEDLDYTEELDWRNKKR
ncbi:putative zinc finger protein [Orchesella cincta]|uniref:Zinc finger protein 830 n=1 Tax=Orchesella cincta TaxID=48709 RepID=A0A1D2MJZ9_ORCCI|nr:putative zinc finger protein [Orchesella cincta]